MIKNEVVRMDIASRKQYPLPELIRLVIKDNSLLLDIENKIQGRGIYIHKDKESINLVFKRKLLKKYAPLSTLTELEAKLNEYVK